MRRSITRAAAAVTVGAALSGLGATGVSAATAAPAGAARWAVAAHSKAVPGARLWVQWYRGGGPGADEATAVAVSPNGGKVYVTGRSPGPPATYYDYATIAYNAKTGARLWVSRYDGPRHSWDNPTAVAVSPDGRRVYVTGDSTGTTSESDYATIAYNAATGARLWVARYNGPGNRFDIAAAIGVSPNGSRVYVTGRSDGKGAGSDYATIGYNAATGARLWVARYNGPSNGADYATGLAVSRAGTLFVTGKSYGRSRVDYITVAYSPAGTRLWIRQYRGSDLPAAVAVSPDGNRVYITGGNFDTIAYKAATGTRLWVRQYNGSATALAVSPAGTLFVTGTTPGTPNATDYATIAYSPAGARLWVSRYNGPGTSYDSAVSVAAPGNGKVYVSGTSEVYAKGSSGWDYATVSYNVFTGARLWAARYDSHKGAHSGEDGAAAIAARAGRVFVTGHSYFYATTPDVYYNATVAYNG